MKEEVERDKKEPKLEAGEGQEAELKEISNNEILKKSKTSRRKVKKEKVM